MIYITSDTHIPEDVYKLNSKNFPEQKKLCKDDYLVICGDFGAVWNNSREDIYWRKWIDDKKFTTLFIDGNHENFNLLNEFPIVDFCGGKAHKIGNSIYHLMRGEVYTIDNKTFFTLGGAQSHDISRRVENVSWWREELPTEKELNYGWENLKKHNFKIDCILSHCAPDSIQNMIAPHYENNRLTSFLEKVMNKTDYGNWFFGHYHANRPDMFGNGRVNMLFDHYMEI